MDFRRIKQVLKYGKKDAELISKMPEVNNSKLSIFIDILVCYFKYRQERDHTYTYAQYFISPKDKKRKITTYMRYNQFEFAGIQFRYTAADLPERENQSSD